jgi:hypothetical protein
MGTANGPRAAIRTAHSCENTEAHWRQIVV